MLALTVGVSSVRALLENNMRKVLAILLVAPLMLTACSKDPKERLQGTWQGKECLDCTDIDKKEAAEWAKTLSFVFDQNKVTVALGEEEPRTNEFEIAESKGDDVTVRLVGAGAHTEPMTLQFKNKDLVVKMGENRSFLLVRKK